MHNTIGVVTRSPTAIHSVYYSATLILNQINIWAFQRIKQRVLPVASKKPVHQQQPSHCQRDESQWLQAMPMPTKRVFPIHLQKSLFHKKKCTSLTVLLNSRADTQKSCSASQQPFHSSGSMLPTSEESGIFGGGHNSSRSTLSTPEYTLKVSSLCL